MSEKTYVTCTICNGTGQRPDPGTWGPGCGACQRTGMREPQLVDVYALLLEIKDAIGQGMPAAVAEPGRPTAIDAKLVPEVTVSPSFSTGDPRLSESIEQYLAQKRHEVAPQHLEIVRLTLKLFLEAMPEDILVVGVYRQDVTKHRQTMLDAGRAVKTVNNHLAIIAAFFAWAVTMGLRKDNPATGLKLRDRQKASHARKAFSREQIKDVVGGLIGYGGKFEKNARTWLPLIMLYTGARPEEVAQLRVRDVRDVELPAGESMNPVEPHCWVFDFATLDDGQRRKNESSRRLVPVHPRLWELGLKELTAHAGSRDSGAGFSSGMQLFPELNPGHNGRLAEAPSRWFNRVWLRDRKQVSDRKLVLYSLRHTVATGLLHKGVAEALISQLLGHSNSSQTTGRYGKEYPVEKLAEAVGQLDWPV